MRRQIEAEQTLTLFSTPGIGVLDVSVNLETQVVQGGLGQNSVTIYESDRVLASIENYFAPGTIHTVSFSELLLTGDGDLTIKLVDTSPGLSTCFSNVQADYTPVVVDAVQKDDYFPFGLTFNHWKNAPPENLYQFQGQEQQKETGWSSFKWRNAMPEIGRFFNVDPLAEEYLYNSPYAFSENKITRHIELEGLEAVVGFSMGGDVEYRMGHLKKLNSNAVTRSITEDTRGSNLPKGTSIRGLSKKSEGTQIAESLIQATADDPNGEVGFVAIWGHGSGGNIYGLQGNSNNPEVGTLSENDLGAIIDGVNNGTIKFSENAQILITACNYGSETVISDGAGGTKTVSMGQVLADVTGATVIAGASVDGVYGDGGVGVKSEVAGQDMVYEVRNYSQGSFMQYKRGEKPKDIGNTISTKELIDKGTQ